MENKMSEDKPLTHFELATNYAYRICGDISMSMIMADHDQDTERTARLIENKGRELLRIAEYLRNLGEEKAYTGVEAGKG